MCLVYFDVLSCSTADRIFYWTLYAIDGTVRDSPHYFLLFPVIGGVCWLFKRLIEIIEIVFFLPLSRRSQQIVEEKAASGRSFLFRSILEKQQIGPRFHQRQTVTRKLHHTVLPGPKQPVSAFLRCERPCCGGSFGGIPGWFLATDRMLVKASSSIEAEVELLQTWASGNSRWNSKF